MSAFPVVATLAGLYGLVSGTAAERPSAAPASPAAIRQPAPARAFTVADSLAAIRWAATRMGIAEPWMERVARCESGLDPYASNGVDLGLYQFLPSTFYHYARILRVRPDIWDPYSQAYVAAAMHRAGLAAQWPICG